MLLRICIGTIRRPLADLVDFCCPEDVVDGAVCRCCYCCLLCFMVEAKSSFVAKLLSKHYAYAPLATLSLSRLESLSNFIPIESKR